MLEILHLSSKLAYLFPNESRYLERAERIWSWLFSFDDGNGLMSELGLVSTGAVPVGTQTRSRSDRKSTK